MAVATPNHRSTHAMATYTDDRHPKRGTRVLRVDTEPEDYAPSFYNLPDGTVTTPNQYTEPNPDPGVMVLVRWHGHTRDWTTWEYSEDLKDAPARG